MTLIKSISGIRGTIGGIESEALTPIDILKYVIAYAQLLEERSDKKSVVIGRDARISGKMVSQLVAGTLTGMGFNVIDLDLSTTPTVEIAVTELDAAGGIIITASHNPKQWNALKLLNEKGEFISAKDGEKIIEKAEKSSKIAFATVEKLGKYSLEDRFIDLHIEKILALPLVDTEAIRKRNFSIAIDCVNSTGGLILPKLLKALGVEVIHELFTEPNGQFPHNPEPLPENLSAIANEVTKNGADLGIAVDPDVDRLALVCEDGSMFGEEYTLVAVADYVLSKKPGNTVSNLSSTQALKIVTEKRGGKYFPSAVGEVNVVEGMKAHQAVIGGEGNGGIIYPELHYGRDAVVGIALFLSHLAHSNCSASRLRAQYPNYHISKNKITINDDVNLEDLFSKIQEKYVNYPSIDIDGLKIEFEEDWVHLRRSNTEPIVRIYAESQNQTTAENIAKRIIEDIKYFAQEQARASV